APFAFPNDLFDDKSLYEIVCFITILTFLGNAKKKIRKNCVKFVTNKKSNSHRLVVTVNI
ncbi:MAG: hypothetical protein R3250_11560, partial [Melioribacteraceae bacterium]|nr:hypothetical protein [Melioribacteraceae bacterium]